MYRNSSSWNGEIIIRSFRFDSRKPKTSSSLSKHSYQGTDKYLRQLTAANKCFTTDDIAKRAESKELDIQCERDSKTTNKIIP